MIQNSSFSRRKSCKRYNMNVLLRASESLVVSMGLLGLTFCFCSFFFFLCIFPLGIEAYADFAVTMTMRDWLFQCSWELFG